MTTLNVGIIGLGAIGQRLLNTFHTHEKANVLAICDTNEQLLTAMKEKLEGVISYIDYKEMLENESIDLVYIAVPPKFHHQIALDVIKKRKHLLCEKPLANSLEEAEEMYQAAKASQRIHGINFPMVYTNVFSQMKQFIKSGQLGELNRVEVHMKFTEWPRSWQKNNWISSREQGGFIREVAPHYIHMIYDIFGELSNVHSFVDYPVQQELCEKGFIVRMELEDQTPVLINGLSGIGQKEHLSFKIYGSKGTVDLVNWSELFVSKGDQAPTRIPLERGNELDIVEEFIHGINNQEAQIVSFQEGLEVQRVLEKIIRS
jgi:predicted dehydrogenase